MHLANPIRNLHHIGAKTEPKLKRLDITSINDLLWHLPRRYEDLSVLKKIHELTDGETVTVKATVELINNKRSFRRRMMITEMQVADETGKLRVVCFRQPHVAKMFRDGDELYLSGKVTSTLIGPQMTAPSYEKIKPEQIHTAGIIPRYQLTEGVTDKQLRFLIKTALDNVPEMPDDLPTEIKEDEKFPDLRSALANVHWPKDQATLDQSINRLKFDELFWMQLQTGYARAATNPLAAPQIPVLENIMAPAIKRLPFELTADQQTALNETMADLTKKTPMHRLVEGDVGSGKTVVAALAAFNCIANGYQVALMVPTEILALQHYASIQALLPEVKMGLATSKHVMRGAKKITKALLQKGLRTGDIELVIGTHSLIQEGVSFLNIGLVIIDEQHRFGVDQRKAITERNNAGLAPHLLSLTATPIPRTLALTLYGDLAISLIKTKPAGRKPITTRLATADKRELAYGFIRQHIAKGEQVFVICPLIEDGISEAKSVTTEFERLSTDVFPHLSIAMLHGKMKAADKKKIIEDFRDKKYNILVSTSVIEVGIDIPNATIIMIEGAERFGLAQLHQFRGRVGRGDKQSYCILFPTTNAGATNQRLKLLTEEQDGFALAEADLGFRGEGNVFGTQQSGIVNFKVATIHDTDLIQKSRSWVERIIAQDTDRSFYNAHEDRLSQTETIHWE